jgi:PPM family protein phosphatase
MQLFGRARRGDRPEESAVAHLSVGVATHLGPVRPENEDHVAFYLPEENEALEARGSLLCVADGMGGHAAGALASQLAVDALLATYYGPLLDRGVDEALRAAYAAANRSVCGVGAERAEVAGMGTTLVTAVVRGANLWVANIGDSRGYLCRQGKLRQLTVDHTAAQEMREQSGGGAGPPEGDYLNHQLTRCIGFDEGNWEPDIATHELRGGDIVLLCSDGLTGPLATEELAEVLRMERSPSVGARLLVERALQRGGRDNITALWARVDVLR